MHAVLLLALAACTGEDTAADTYPMAPRDLVVPTADFFVDISDASGMRVDNYYADPPAGTAINDHSRLAFADLDGDGLDDMVMHSLFPNPQAGVPFEHLVFLNNGDGTFTDHSTASGLRDVQAAFFAFADVDDDGDQDVYAGLDLSLSGESHGIYLNDGSGVFTRLQNSGVESASSTATNAVFGDFNGDGDVDLYVGRGGTTYIAKDLLYLGQGDGHFEAASSWLPGAPRQPSNGTTTCDWDEDGDLDVFVSTYSVSTDSGLNHLWRNQGDHFEEVAGEVGFASLCTGNYATPSTGYGQDLEETDGACVGSNGFGIDCGDVNGDGYLDVLVTAISHPSATDYGRKWSDPSHLLLNQGPDAGYALEAAWLDLGLPFNEGDVDGALVDFDLDGRLDISLSRDKKYEGSYDEIDQKAWFGLMHQQEDGRFESLGYVSGINDPPEPDLWRMKNAQNHVWADIDADGDLDLLVGGRDTGGGRPNFLFENTLGQDNRWLRVRVEGDGDTVHRDAFGTRVILRDTDKRRVREKRSSRGMYNSEDTRVLHFGLNGFDASCELEVVWPDGTSVVYQGGEDFGDDMELVLSYPDGIEVR